MDWTHFASTFISAMGKIIILWLQVFKPQNLFDFAKSANMLQFGKKGSAKSDFCQISLVFIENLSTGLITITLRVSKFFI